MPRQLSDSAAAADALKVTATITCDQCTRPFVTSARNARHRRWCSPACSDAAAEALGHAPKPRSADPDHPPPAIRPLPRPPDCAGTCALAPLDGVTALACYHERGCRWFSRQLSAFLGYPRGELRRTPCCRATDSQ
jgi:hypothetical protein